MDIPKSLNWKRVSVIVCKLLLLISVFGGTLYYSPLIYKKIKNTIQEEYTIGSKVIMIDSVPIQVEIADTYQKRTLGLSGRTKLAPGRGMFFEFEESDMYAIWMKDMKFNIDILWFDEEGKIIFIKENVSPNTYPETFKPTIPAKYVLEVPAGFVSKHHIQKGNNVDFY